MYSRILVIVTRRIGDVLLTTPLLHSLKKAYPEAKIDALVLKGTASILEGNSDIHEVIECSEKPNKAEYRVLIKQLWRQYDLSISTLPGDRPTLFAWVASKKRIGMLHGLTKANIWKRWVFSKWAAYDDQKWHVVIQNKQLTDLLGIESSLKVVPPFSENSRKVVVEILGETFFKAGNYCVIHPKPMYRYKELSTTTWVDLGNFFVKKGLSVILTGGPDPKEIELCESIRQQIDGALNLAGKLHFADLSFLLTHSQYFVGPDTSVTHLAAACGVKTLAIFGPTSPVRWGPWPSEETIQEVCTPYNKVGELQQFGNISVYQPPRGCIPCQNEGCDKHRGSDSLCLREVSIDDLVKHLPKSLAYRPINNNEI